MIKKQKILAFETLASNRKGGDTRENKLQKCCFHRL